MNGLIDFGIIVLKAALMMGALLHLAAMCTWIERKGAALIQDRVGANRASIFGFDLAGVINTLVCDPVKAIMKEDWVPRGTSQLMHSLAPFMAVFPVILSFAVIPFGPSFMVGDRTITMQVANLNVGVLYVFAMGSLAVYGVFLAGWVSSNKFSLFGGLRASAQMISYEVTMGFSLVGILAVYQSLDLNHIIAAQTGTFLHFLPRWGVFMNPVGFILFFISMMAETKRAPFDLAESESELVAGYMTEYSGMKFLLFWLGEFAEIVVASALISVIFLGGWQLPYFDIRTLPLPWAPLVGAAVFGAKTLALCILQIVIRWTLPRFRYDQLMNLCWKLMFPIALVNLIATVFLLLKGFYN